MTRRLTLSLVTAALGVALLVAGLARPAGGVTEARKGGTLRLASSEDVGPLDTALGYSPNPWRISFATCAKLFNHPDEAGPSGTNIVPEVVRSHTVSRDGLVYDFELRRTFRFHTGAPVTAQSFAAAFNRNANPKLEANYATTFMHEIAGAEAVMDGTAERISGVRVRGRYGLQIRLTKRLGDFIARLTLPFFCPVGPNTPNVAIDNPAGSGPYYVAEHVVNRRTVLKRNPYYRGERPANVDQVIWTVDESPASCLVAIEQDRIDHCDVPGPAFESLAEKYQLNRPGGQLFVSPALTTWYLAFNHDRPAFKGPGQIPLKMAINFALDRASLVRPFGRLAGKRTDQMLPPALARGESIYPLGGPNLVAAKRLYAKARFRPTRLVFYTANRPPVVAQALALEFQLEQLGIDLDVRYFDNETLLEKAETRGEPFDIVRNGWAADYADGGSFLRPLVYGGDLQATDNLNVSYFNDPQTNARIEAANKLTDEARRRAWQDLDVDLMRNDPPMAPLYHPNDRSFVSRSFGCFLLHPFYGVDIAAACKK